MTKKTVSLEAPTANQLALQVGAATLSRLFLNTSRRFGYFYVPALSQGLGVTPAAFSSLLAVNQFTGIFSPLFGPLSDRFGYRVMMILGLILLAVGMLAGGWLPSYGVILLALFLAGLGKSIFDPALQAFAGQYVPFERRGLVIGIIEFAWAGSSLFGVPLAGQLIQNLGWQAPFLVLGTMGILGAVALSLLIPARQTAPGHIRHPIDFKSAWRQLSRSPIALSALGYGFLASMANDTLFVVMSIWLDSLGVTLATIGRMAVVIGVAELVGELLTAFAADRIGLRRSVVVGSILACLGYLLLPFIGLTVPWAMVGLFLLFLCFEFSFVTAISLFTEVLPEARATMMSAYVAIVSLGRVVGTLLGAVVWSVGGIFAVSWVSMVLAALGLICLIWGLQRWQTQLQN